MKRAPRSVLTPVFLSVFAAGALAVSNCGLVKSDDAKQSARPPATDSKGSVLPPELKPPPEDVPDGDEEPTTTTTRPPRSFSLAFSGDILLHNNVIQSGVANAKSKNADGTTAYDFNPMFDDVRETISKADVAICHQETPISPVNKNLTVPRTLSFNAPKEIAAALKGAGYDGCENASNHLMDRELKGLQDTIDVQEQNGLKVTGTARSQVEAENPPIYEAKGVKIGHLAYTYTIYNNAGPNNQVPTEAPWLKNYLWPLLGAKGMSEQAAKMKARGAEFIVMSIHWGDQYVHQPNAQQRQLAKDLLADPNIDLIVGDHVHVVQPCEKIGNKYVTYGMGNFLSNQSPNQDSTLVSANQDGTIQSFDLNETAPGTFTVTKFTYTPTWVVIPGHKITRATPDKFKDSYDRTVKNMNLLGAGTCDAVPAF